MFFILDVYTDGSYNKTTGLSAGAFVLVKNDEIVYDSSFIVFDNGKNNVRGELEAVIRAIQYCKKIGEKEINLYFDYAGIEKWLSGEWKIKDTLTHNFVKIINESEIKIHFQKVKSHSGNKFNEVADVLCSDLTQPETLTV